MPPIGGAYNGSDRGRRRVLPRSDSGLSMLKRGFRWLG
jgi:hypothetical protein